MTSTRTTHAAHAGTDRAAADGPVGGRWMIDPGRSRVSFLVCKLGVIPVPGRFRDIQGTLNLAPGEPVRAEMTIAAASITTYLPPRDVQVRGRQFLDAGRYPAIRARAVAAQRNDEGGVEATVALQIKGRVGDLQLGGRYQLAGGGELAIDLRGHLDRRDFGIRPFLGFGGILIGNRIRVRAKLTYLPASQQKPEDGGYDTEAVAGSGWALRP